MQKEITIPVKLVRLSWVGRYGLESYLFTWTDALKVLEQMGSIYSPITLWIHTVGHSPDE